MMTTTDNDDTEVRRAKRSWPGQFKLDILTEIDVAKASGEPGAVGAICRREGLYSSLISEWRRQRDQGALHGLTDAKPGRKTVDRTRAELARLRGRVGQLEGELDVANELIAAQGKVSALLQEMSRQSAAQNTTTP